MAYRNVFQPSWRFGQPRQFSYGNAFQPSWAMDQPRQRQAEPMPANSAQARAATEDEQQPLVPFDAALTDAYATADLNYQNTIAAIAAREPMIRRSFGYDEQGGIDASNPFGRAQLLQRAYQQTKTGTGNQYAARGQLYSGALQRAQNENQFNYQAQDAQLRGSYTQQLAELADLRANATNTRNNARSSAYWDFVMGQIADRNAPPADPMPGQVPAPGPDGSFASYAGTPVEAYLRALAAQQQYVPPPTPVDTIEGPTQPYDIPIAPNSPPSVQRSAAASGLGALVGRLARRGRR